MIGIGLVVRDDVLGNVDGSEELDAVAHGDAVFELGVVLADEIAADGRHGSAAALGSQQTRGKKKKQGNLRITDDGTHDTSRTKAKHIGPQINADERR